MMQDVYGTHRKPVPDPEKYWDEKLQIRTCGRDDSAEDENHFPYEPTPYSVLLRLSESGWIGRNRHVIDYGSGKGRTVFFLHHMCGCRVTGVEFNASLFSEAQENLNTYAGGRKGISFSFGGAERFRVPEDADVFWFFNPFSIKILRTVIGQILESYYVVPRDMKLLFYYPSDETVSFLMTCDGLQFDDEIDCRDLFPGDDPRERILIFETV